MRATALALALALALVTTAATLAGVALAQSRAPDQSQSQSPRPAPAAPRVHLVRVAGVPEARALATIAQHADAVGRCVEAARAEDPVGLEAVTSATARLRLQADGAVSMVELDPSNLARGLSACLAAELLGWRFGGVSGRAAAVRVQIHLGP